MFINMDYFINKLLRDASSDRRKTVSNTTLQVDASSQGGEMTVVIASQSYVVTVVEEMVR